MHGTCVANKLLKIMNIVIFLRGSKNDYGYCLFDFAAKINTQIESVRSNWSEYFLEKNPVSQKGC